MSRILAIVPMGTPRASITTSIGSLVSVTMSALVMLAVGFSRRRPLTETTRKVGNETSSGRNTSIGARSGAVGFVLPVNSCSKASKRMRPGAPEPP